VLFEEAMKSNITLKLDRDLLRRAKVIAAERDTSVSALVAEQLEKAVRERDGYEQAKRRALATLKKGFDLGFKPPASRDELHER
jgi:predicted transcriptional regulator